MNERSVSVAKAVVDLAYTSLAVALLAYTMRNEIKRVVAVKRAEIAAHVDTVRTTERMVKAGRGFLSYLRDHGVEPTIAERVEYGGSPDA